MSLLLKLLAALILVIVAVLLLWRWTDTRADGAERARLLALQPPAPARFDPAMVADLPEPARRYFTFSIAPDTPLYPVAEIAMTGRIGQGTKDAPGYMSMTGKQVLALPHGFVWQIAARQGAVRMSGSDTGTWTRFWLFDLLPVVRAGGTDDHRRSAFGRYAAEAVFWTPAALLPGPGVDWSAVDEGTARVTITHGDLTQAIDLTVDAQGRPTVVQFPRWTNANPEGVFQVQPFGGELSAFETFNGFTLPTHVEAGNHFGTDAYFPFYIADVTDISFPTER